MAQNQVERASAVAKDNLKEMPHAAQSVVSDAREIAEQGLDYFNSNIDTVRSQAKRAYKASESVIRENPFYAIAGAVAVGALLGVLIARSRR